ncbi:hypothetical protein H8356DRAFT_1352739 [Neocallimastix lanati (nom. inval.)]|nr:hypothetical protein H8356DRAFT_1352739 [Neocallimastix sp. JGI-2020a]
MVILINKIYVNNFNDTFDIKQICVVTYLLIKYNDTIKKLVAHKSPAYQKLVEISGVCNNKLIEEEQKLQHQFSQSVYQNENKQNKVNLEDNIDLMDEYNNENMLDNNSENEKINEDKINEDKINEDKINEDIISDDRISDDYINENQKLAENQEEILKNSNIEENIKKLIENRIENNHKNLANMKMNEKLNLENNKI